MNKKECPKSKTGKHFFGESFQPYIKGSTIVFPGKKTFKCLCCGVKK